VLGGTTIVRRFGGFPTSLHDLSEDEYIFEYYGGVGEEERKGLEKDMFEDFPWDLPEGYILREDSFL